MQRFVCVAWIAGALGWLGWFAWREQGWLAVAGALLIAGAHGVVLAVEFALLPWINRHDPAPAATPRMLIAAWWSEVRWSTRVFAWEQPWRPQVEPDHLPPGSMGRRGVVLVHGFVCNRGFWNAWMPRLRAGDVPFVAVNLEPVLSPIERYAAIVDDAVRRVERATGQPPVIVAHSMGGLAVRWWLCEHDADARVHSVITIGTPHQGTWFARYGLAHNARQMRHRCDWVESLGRREADSRRRLYTCFYSHCDNIACPASTGAIPGADNRHVMGAAHVALAFRQEVFEALWERIGPAGLAEAPATRRQRAAAGGSAPGAD